MKAMFSKSTVKVYILGAAFILALTRVPSAHAEGFNVNSQVTFDPLTNTYRSVDDVTGCPAGFVGKFTFKALLTNKAGGSALPGVTVRVHALTNGNVLLDPQTNAVLGGEGAVMEVPKVAQYADGLLSPGESVQVPFVLCLRAWQPFQFFVDVSGVITELVSINRFGTDSAGGGVSAISADGRFVAFTSGADDLNTGGEECRPAAILPTLDCLFIRDLATGTTTLIASEILGRAAFSPDDRFIAFTVRLGGEFHHPSGDLFVRDLTRGTTFLVSVSRTGTDHQHGDIISSGAAFSADGRFVVFNSNASDLVQNDTNGTSDVFVRDLQTGTTALVSANRFGTNSGNKTSGSAGFSANGRFVLFRSDATDLVATDINPAGGNVFVRDLQTGTTTLVSVNRFGTASGNGDSKNPVFSVDGHFAVFASYASDLVENDTNGHLDIFVRDLQAGTTTLVSVNRFGTNSGNANSQIAAISADGRFVAFGSDATDLVANNDTNGTSDLFVRDLLTGTTALVSINQFGTSSGNRYSPYSSLAFSPDGRFLMFDSWASDLVQNDTNDTLDVFVRDLQTGTTTLVSVNRLGTGSGNEGSGGGAALSADGRVIAFTSSSSDLVPNDSNGQEDVFVRPVH